MKLTSLKSQGRRVLVYGPSGSGKTLAVARLASHLKLKVLDCEFGWGVASQIPPEHQDNIDIVQIADNPTNPEAAYALLSLLRGQDFSVCHTHNKFKCALCKPEQKTVWKLSDLSSPDTILVVDSLTQLTDSIVNNIIKTKSNGTMEYAMQIQDWGKGNNVMSGILSYLQSLGINVICISHEKDISPEESTSKQLAPVIMTKEFSRVSHKFFDASVFAVFQNLKYRLIVNQAGLPSGTVKSRYENTVEKDGSLHSLFGITGVQNGHIKN